MKQSELNALIQGIGGGLEPTLKIIGDNFDKLTERIKALEQERTKTLADAYRGTHLVGNRYERGLLVTCDGSLWLALKETTARPGNSADWKLIVKAGRDGKDAKQ